MPQHFDKFTTSCQVDRRHHLLKSMSLCSEKNAIGRQQVRPQRILTAAAWPYSEILISALSNQNLALLSIFSAYPILKWTCLCYFFFFYHHSLCSHLIEELQLESPCSHWVYYSVHSCRAARICTGVLCIPVSAFSMMSIWMHWLHRHDRCVSPNSHCLCSGTVIHTDVILATASHLTSVGRPAQGCIEYLCISVWVNYTGVYQFSLIERGLSQQGACCVALRIFCFYARVQLIQTVGP